MIGTTSCDAPVRSSMNLQLEERIDFSIGGAPREL
jgi:hypothetical protein